MNSWSAPLRRVSRRVLIVLCVLLVIAVIVRLLLPGILLRQINRRLSHIPAYSGHVDSVGVQLWHGGYSMHGLVIRKRDAGGATEPFVAIGDLYFSIAYRELIHRRFVSDIEIHEGQINFVRSPSAEQNQNLGKAPQPTGQAPKPDQRWQDVVHDLFPIDITHLELHDSRIHFIDLTSQPRIDLSVDHLEVDASGLQNRQEKGGPALPAVINLHGNTIGRGHLSLFIAAEPLADQPHFQMKVSLENVSLPALNDFLMAYAGVDVSKGDLQLYTEISGENGTFHGYVKPLFTDLHFETRSDAKKNPLQLLWKDLVAATTKLLRDKQNKQVATLVPFSGKFEQGASVRVLTTIGNLLRNGFIEAIRRGLEGNAATTGEKPPKS